jgi:hypothetical protein
VTITGFEYGRGRPFARSLAQYVDRANGASGRMTRFTYKLCGELELVAKVKKRRLQYLDHVVRMEDD